MTIEQPDKNPESLRSMEVDFATTVCQSIWLKIVNNHDWVDRNIPIGMVVFFYQSQEDGDGETTEGINTQIWKFCDGSLINDSESPLNGKNAPDFSDRFFKQDFFAGTLAGSDTVNLGHSHNGQTAVETDLVSTAEVEPGGDFFIGETHSHPIQNDLLTPESVVPRYTAIQAYMRIK